MLAREIMADDADVLTLLKGEELAEAELERDTRRYQRARRRPGGGGQGWRPAAVSSTDGGRVTTAVVTDSTTSLAPGVLERPDVRVVPLTFHFGEDEAYTDKVDMTNEEFYERLRDSTSSRQRRNPPQVPSSRPTRRSPTTTTSWCSRSRASSAAPTTRPCRRRGW